MTDWIEHTTDTCPVDPETVVEVRYRGAPIARRDEARFMGWHRGSITHYRIITPAPTPPLFLGGDPAKPPEPEMTNPPNYLDTLSEEQRRAVLLSCPPEPDLITLRLECLKLAVAQTIQFGLSEKKGHGYLAIEELSDEYVHYVLNGSVDKA